MEEKNGWLYAGDLRIKISSITAYNSRGSDINIWTNDGEAYIVGGSIIDLDAIIEKYQISLR